MSSPFIGEIRIVSFNYAPRGWAACNGQTMSIQQNSALFSILGTTFGGNGVNTFMLPNFQGLVPYHPGANRFGSNYSIGEVGGVANVALNVNQIPSHTHSMMGSTANANKGQVANNIWPTQAKSSYDTGTTGNMNPTVIGTFGGQPHTNMSPFLTLNFIIALIGIYPSRG